MATATKDVSLNKKVSQFFWRSWAIQASWNYERQMNMGFLYGMVPTLDRLYPDESDPKQLAAKKEAYHRHMAFYNCTPQTSAFILGLAASMEEEYAKDPENFDPDSINAVKTSLMGPLSGANRRDRDSGIVYKTPCPKYWLPSVPCIRGKQCWGQRRRKNGRRM